MGRRGLESRWVQSPLLALALAAAAAIALGILSAATSPVVVAAAVLGLAVLGATIAEPRLGLFLFVAVVATLPFGVVPVRIGVQFTLVDVVLIATFAGLLVRLPSLTQTGGRFRLGAPGVLLLAFVVESAIAFLAGASAVDSEMLRRFAKLVASLLLFVVALNLLVDHPSSLDWLLRALMLGGALAGGVGAALWLLPPNTQLSLLTRLQAVGYPTADMLRYVPGPNGTYTTQLRATGTAVDPNVFGGTVMLAVALIAFQLLSRGRLLPRPILLLLGLPALAGLMTSYSRAAWLGLAVGVLMVGTLYDRRVWLAVPLGLAGLVGTPPGRAALERFVTGFSSSDPATALRFGEYHNALTLIQRYPLLGIGFGPSPDADVTAGVSSVYLLVGEQTGLMGLALYLAALAAVGVAGLGALRRTHDARQRGRLAGLLAALLGALAAGVLDHYFANQVFPHAVALFWLYAALLVACSLQSPADSRASAPASHSRVQADWRSATRAGVTPTPARPGGQAG